jgi:N utilization substance protein A
MMVASIQQEILLVADSVAREKGIDREEVLIAMEEAVQKIGRTKYGLENDIRASIDRKTGEIRLARYREVVENVEDPLVHISLTDAHQLNPQAEIGSFIVEALPPIEFGRVAAQTARQIISQRVREAERQRQYLEFKDRIGEIVHGIVKRVEFGNYIIDIGRTEALLRRDEALPRESMRPGDRARAYIMDVQREARGPQVLLSRAHPQFMAKLFYHEVPEIYEGIIEILSVARDPGSRAKIAVRSKDVTIDPVGACVGIRGSRVQAVVNELQGEKVDIVLWSEDLPTFVINALAPAEISKVIFHEEENKVEVVVPEDQLSLAIGRRGQNVRLASLLTRLDISIISENEEVERRAEEFKKQTNLFIQALDVDEVLAHLLTAEGFTTLEDIVGVDSAELASIEGFDEDLAQELQKRAAQYLKAREVALKAELKTLNIAEDLKSLDGLSQEVLVKVGKNGIKTLDDFADLASDELIEMTGSDLLTTAEANELIMKARAHWFDEEK